jgi:cell division transport system permease protein
MALKVDYVLRETGTNLRRNFTLTLASIVTVAVSLALVGASLLVRQGVQNATARWQGGVEFIIFLDPQIDPAQRSALSDLLDENPEVKSTMYVDQEAAYEEFKELFRDSPDTVESIGPADLPPSFRVVPTDPTAESVQSLVTYYRDQPGVFRVVAAADSIKKLQRLSGILATAIVGVAIFLLVAAGLLILNTIRMAMFARRREIEVMKLVGATNWFIRVPFMVEGLIHGLVGAALAIGGMLGLNWLFENRLAAGGEQGEGIDILNNFLVHTSDVVNNSLLIAAVGVVVGVVGSALAVSRFLDV